MRNIKKVLIIILILGITCHFGNFEMKASEIEKGSLRCPLNSSNCVEIKDANGQVSEVRVTKRENLENNSYINIVKIIKKTSTLGKYEVKFEVSGNLKDVEKQNETAYVYIIIDTSDSLVEHGSYRNLRSAVINFSNNMVQDGHDIALEQFANITRTLISFNKNISYVSDSDFLCGNCNSREKCQRCFEDRIGKASHLEKALKNAYDALKNVESEKKFVIVFGDGQYWQYANTDWTKVTKWRDELRSIDTRIFAIQFELATHDKGNIESRLCTQYNLATRGECSIYYMKQLVNSVASDYYWNGTSTNYDAIYEDIRGKIMDSVDKVNFDAVLTDNLGAEFYVTDDNTTKKTFKLNSIKETPITTDPFYINIDEYASTGWHDTNDSFQFTYTNINEEEKIISCDINPEVYWVQENLTINSCSGAVTSDVVVSSSEDYFSKTCYEGYTRNGRYYNGLSVNVKVNNLNDGIKYFDLDGGIGFPANIKLSTNVVCSYEFLYDQYQSDYSDLTKQLEETKDPKDRASLIMRLEAMDNILSTYLPLSNSDLVTYSNNFSKQKASLRITYDGSNEIDTINFVDSSEVSSNLRCETEMTRVINGRTLSVKENCYLSMSKEMSLPSVCVDMQTGEMVECDSSDSQIAGGNKFYTSLKEKSGKVYVSVPNAGYSGDKNIKLEDCAFSLGDIDLLYRTIELDDPFLQTYTKPKREYPNNYLNNQFNFINVIKDNIWYSDFLYRFTLNKVNVNNIKNDTNNYGLSSYSGQNCYISNNKKYVCEFIRSDESQVNYFTKVEINEKIT